jgi:hypothetical protein
VTQLTQWDIRHRHNFSSRSLHTGSEAHVASSLLNICSLRSAELRQSYTPDLKCTLVHSLRLYTGRTAHRGSRGIALTFHYHGTRRGEGSGSRPGRSLPLGKTRYPLYRRLGGPQGLSGQLQKTSTPQAFDPHTFNPVASRYTDYATRPTHLNYLGLLPGAMCGSILILTFFV